MQTSDAGVEFIKRFEAFRSSPYLCPGGYRTIGYGHKIGAYEKKFCTDIEIVITEFDALEILKMDLCAAETAVRRNIYNMLNQHQFDALVSFVFNCGSGAFQRSCLRQKINYGAYGDAQYEFMRWVYVKGKKVKGLVIRRKMESVIFSSNFYAK